MLYQRYHFDKAVSTWIFIQVPVSIQAQLERAIPEGEVIGNASAKVTPHPMALHALFLVSSQRHWAEYLKYLAG